MNLDQNAILDLLTSVLDEFEESIKVSHPLVEVSNPLLPFYRKIENYIRTRGWKELLLVSFPDACKVYDKALNGNIEWHNLPSTFGPPNHYGELSQSWLYTLLKWTVSSSGIPGYGDIDCYNQPAHEPDVNLVYFTRQVLLMFKKLKLDCPEERTNNAVKTFFDLEADLRSPSGTWDHDIYVPHRFKFLPRCHSGIKDGSFRALLRTVDSVSAILTPSRRVDLTEVIPKHGPGAVADGRTGDDKYLFPFWPLKLERTFEYSYFGTVNQTLFSESALSQASENDLSLWTDRSKKLSPLEPPARLIAVPKTFKGPRLIASEPTAHQFLQQGLLRWIRKYLPNPLRNCIDFTSQLPSQEGAREASISGDRATVDLSSASDRLTCWTVERVFGANQTFLNALHAVRTRHIIDSVTDSDVPQACKLKKFAAQGSAVTFPVQSMVYAMFCIASVLHTEGKKPSRRNIEKASRKVRVFGDDIILPSSATEALDALMRYNNLKVNWDKTHVNGRFRESCGADMYRGHDVTPTYISAIRLGTKARAEAIQSWVDVSNNAHRAGLWKLSSYMKSQIPQKLLRILLVSRDEGPGIRLFSYSSVDFIHTKPVWNKSLHRYEARCLTAVTRTQKESRGSLDDLLDYFLQAPCPETFWTHGNVRGSCLVLTKQRVPATLGWMVENRP